MVIIKKFSFDAAHYLPRYHGKCERLHGHTYGLVVKLEGTPDAEGMVMDFTQLKQVVTEKVLQRLDHQLLNEVVENPSAENLAIWVWDQLVEAVYAKNRRLCAVEVWETRTSGCVYTGEFYTGEEV